MTDVTPSAAERLFERFVVAPARAASTLTRAGLADPLLAGATARSLARWGPSLAAMYHASALRHPSRAAVIDDDGSVTFAELDRRTDRLAGALAARGDASTIGILCRNHRGFVATAIAAAKAGASTVYLNTGFAAPQLADVAAREGVTVIVHDKEFADMVAGLDPAVVRVVVDGDGPGSLDALAGAGRGAPARPRRSEQPVLLTSGTTGTPKGARRARPRLDPNAAVGLLEAIPYRTSDVFVVPAPLFHAWGMSQMLLAAALGAPIVIRRTFDPAVVLADVAHHRATVLAAVPVMLMRILRDTPPDAHDTSTLRIVAASGSALAGPLATQWMDRFGDTLYNMYGSTEVGQATVAGPADLRRHPGTAGRAVAGSQLRILDEHGNALPTGTTGRIFVGSANHFSGYTGGGSKAVIGGLMETGDVGHLDTTGLLFVTGRADDMIVSGGENVFPAEVEDLLAGHPAIAEVAVVGVDDEELGQRLRAVVVTHKGARLTSKQVRDHVRAHLARHKVPRDVVFVDALPRNAAGKIIRASLR